MIKHFFASVACGLALIGMVGCGGVSRPETVEVTGSVMYKGKPVEGAEVNFWGATAPRAATGVTDAEGKFTLSMFETGDGCMPGENVITIIKVDPGSVIPATSPEAMMNDPSAMARMAQDMSKGGASLGPKSLIPDKYSKRNTTPLKETISADNNSFPFNLTD